MREKASSVPTHFMHTFVPMAPKPQPKEGAVAPPEFLLGEAGGAGSKRQAIWAQYCMAEEEVRSPAPSPPRTLVPTREAREDKLRAACLSNAAAGG